MNTWDSMKSEKYNQLRPHVNRKRLRYNLLKCLNTKNRMNPRTHWAMKTYTGRANDSLNRFKGGN